MTRSEVYNTKQKDLIIDCIKSKTNEFTIKDIYNDLNSSVGLTTIYRLIDKLIEELYIKVTNIKEIDSKGEEMYAYACYTYDDGECASVQKYLR